MDDEDRFRSALHGALDPLNPPATHLIDGAIARGIRSRRRRRAAELGTGAAVLVGVAAIIVIALPGGGHPGATGAAGTHDAPPAATTGAPAPTPTASAPAAVRVPVTPQVLLTTARATLPRPGTVRAYGGNFSAGWANTWFVYDDGHGAAEVMISVSSSPSGDEATQPCRADTTGCTVLADGGHVRTSIGKEFQDGRRGPSSTERDFSLVRRDGVGINILEWNAPREKDAALARKAPPFSIAELTSWARRPVWDATVPAARAAKVAGLFRPIDLDDPVPTSAVATSADPAQQAKNCKLAEQIKKTAPSYCHSTAIPRPSDPRRPPHASTPSP